MARALQTNVSYAIHTNSPILQSSYFKVQKLIRIRQKSIPVLLQ